MHTVIHAVIHTYMHAYIHGSRLLVLKLASPVCAEHPSEHRQDKFSDQAQGHPHVQRILCSQFLTRSSSLSTCSLAPGRSRLGYWPLEHHLWDPPAGELHSPSTLEVFNYHFARYISLLHCLFSRPVRIRRGDHAVEHHQDDLLAPVLQCVQGKPLYKLDLE